MVGTVIKNIGLTLVFSFSIIFSQTQPNYVRISTYMEIPGSETPGSIVTTSYSDGLGRSLQSQLFLNDLNKSVISATVYDLIGRPAITIVPFANPGMDFITGNLVAKANFFHADNYSFSAIEYADNPSNLVTKQGAPGKSFSLDGDVDGKHHTKFWYFGEATATCIPCSELQEAQLDVRPNDNDAAFFLTVTKDPNGNFSQTVKDMSGKVIRTWSHPEQRGKVGTAACDETKAIIARYENDILGNVKAEYPPLASMHPTTYSYNPLGQLISKSTVDQGTIDYRYSITGLLDTISDQKMKDIVTLNSSLSSIYLINSYDFIGRLIETYTDTTKTGGIHSYQVKTRTFYDDAYKAVEFICPATSTNQDLLKLRSILLDPTTNPTNLNYPQNTRGRVAVVVAYGESCAPVTSPDAYCSENSDRVIEVFSYNQDGLVERKWKYIPFIPLQEVNYTYDGINGNLTKEIIIFSNIPHPNYQQLIREYTYDVNGHLKTISINGKVAVTYSYDYRGRVLDKTFATTKGSSAGIYQYTYDQLHDWVTNINFNMFSEDITYLNNSAPVAAKQYNGNISKTIVNQATLKNKILDLGYAYDDVNRLTGVTHSSPVSDDNRFDAYYAYDEQGRIKSKREGEDPLAASDATNDYQYENAGARSTSNRLSYVTSKHGSANYVYDPNGNMAVDKSKKMGVRYDWRNLPVEFRFYSSIPADVTWDEAVELETKRPGVQLVSSVKMLYDAAGNRVIKEELK